MHYSIILFNKKGESEWFQESFLPGMRIPKRVEAMLKVEFADRYNLCDGCKMDCCCHPMDETGHKFCTILFQDAIRPPWKLKDVCGSHR